MLNNHLKIALRSMRRNVIFTLINVAGLSLGITSCLLISLYIYHETTYDRWFSHSDRIYRVVSHTNASDPLKESSTTPMAVGTLIEANYPEVEVATRLHKLFWHPVINVKVGTRTFPETKILLGDNNFFEIFDLKIIEGEKTTALDAKSKVILTETTAKRYFGNKSALGKVLKVDFGREITVSAVIVV